jgi:hypothetical protein
MSENFIRPTSDATRKIVQDSTHQDEFIGDAYERMKSELRASMGMLSPQAAAEAASGAAAIAPVVPLPVQRAAEPTHMRVIYPSGNSRFEIYGTSDADLDVQEERIRGIYQQ